MSEMYLSQKEVGRRITEVRKSKGYSQEDLAKMIGISRPSLVQVELGRRGIDVLELQRFSHVLSFSLDDFMSHDFSIGSKTIFSEHPSTTILEERISSPVLKEKKFKAVLLYILERCAGKPNVGETVLYKLLYFSDFNYYEFYEEHLTGAVYRKFPFGPVPKQFDGIVLQMIENNQLKRLKTNYHGYPQTRYLPLERADLTIFKASEKDIIDKVIDQMSDWSAHAISTYSHKDMPWVASKDGEEIDYELVFYREMPFSVRYYGEEISEK
jgi:transcriptional regulator with XRE-family HTH domain